MLQSLSPNYKTEVNMSTLKTTLTGYTGYRGREGHYAFLLHRITGLGTVLFLVIHIIDIALVYLSPKGFLDVVALYQTTLFGIGEIALVFCVFFHGINGLRIAYFDMFKPANWSIETERNSTRITLIATLILWLPATFFMARNILIHNYGLFGG
ncbi:MAG TPA: succinate dehydrogenase, cytochrome b556 subunit [Anaerolineaceae bacterium]|nr:succinate dehydrogenase, cytochrome b556 subunit [Anaerolineaceae bacterium]